MTKPLILALLKKTREEIGVTQEELSVMADVSPRTIQRIEAGAPTSISTAKSIASSLELPSYEVLLDSSSKNTPRPVTKEEKISKYKIKDFCFKNKQILALSLAFFLMALLTFLAIQVEKNYFFIAAILVFFIPQATLIALTKEEDCVPKEKSRSPTFTLYALLLLGMSITQIAFSFFVLNSLFKTPEDIALKMNLLSNYLALEPFSISFWFIDNSGYLWVASAFSAIVSLLLMHILIERARKLHMFHFGNFCKFYANFLLYGFLISAILKTDFLKAMQPYNYLVYLGGIVIYILLVYIYSSKKPSIQKKDRVSFFMSGAIFFVPAVISGFVVLSIMDIKRVDFLRNIDSKEKSRFCKEENLQPAICWGARILKEEGIEISKYTLDLIDAKNGKTSALWSVLLQLDYGVGVENSMPVFTDESIDFVTSSYLRMIEYKKEKGLLDYFLLLNQDEKMRVFFDSEETIEWTKDALSDKALFARNFKDAPYGIRNNSHLKTIYTMITGDWDVKTINEKSYYSGGIILLHSESGVFYKRNGKISFDLMGKVHRINSDKLPKPED